ncbi:LLM class flavin-dependent oxidoreductase [Alicyclobacillus kakegawensis]|uniref:LLM class flavin-dependent oxidoreductase n=1 Tax=Alicyclobacillus kakegawensis TaxID=392012 RepID=UPI00082CE9BE|nr:LLM class flavin-dependent oxidoreductase [Alicyclobacillus kakegawensis]
MKHDRIYLNAFVMNCVSHQSPGLWTHPSDQGYRYTDIDFWAELAQTLERGRFDAVFLADVLGVYDVYQGSRDAAVRHAAQVPLNDPMLIVPVMAQVTTRLGFGVTASVSYEPPYLFARRMSTLDHLTKGRVGWNIVTSYLDSAARNLGLQRQMDHDARYDIAEEYLEVCYKLWEGSWEDDAVVRDRRRGVYAEPDKVHAIGHHGTYFTVPGIHLCEPSPQRTPVLYQAGVSRRGRAFAARHAECVFIIAPTLAMAKTYVQSIRAEAEKIGRDPSQIRVFSMFTPIVGRTQAEAEEKYLDYIQHASYEGALALYGGWSGLDLSKYGPSEPLQYVRSDAIHSAVEVFTKMDPDRQWTVEEIARFIGIGGRGPVFVGTADRIADEMKAWVDEAGVDGFNVAYAVIPGTFVDFVDMVVPTLQRRGLVWNDYAFDTLRGNLYGGRPYLPDDHPGRQVQVRN